MKKVKRRYICLLEITILLIIAVFVCVELRQVSVVSSTVFAAGEQTEITLYVVANTLKKIDKESLVRDTISRYREINGKRENEIYTLVLYRTMIHYRNNRECDIVTCDEKGIINEGL